MTPMPASPLAKLIEHEIETTGPIPLARYMTLALSHREYGYYMKGDPFGAQGDFTTAPEISQMFGEMLGLWCADTWTKALSGQRVFLAELGPGRGTLMADALRAARVAPAFFEAAEIHLVETSPFLRKCQNSTLAQSGKSVLWHDRFEDLPKGPVLVLANELLDALPFHQFERRDGHWHERCVAIGPDGGFCFGLAPDPCLPGLIPPGLAATDAANDEGAIFEISPQRQLLVEALAARLKKYGGAALIIDYGHDQPGTGDTFQAMRRHGYADPLLAPGDADLTSHVDFHALALAAIGAGARVAGIAAMGPFLQAMGIDARAENLKAADNGKSAKDIDDAICRLTASDQMGSLFKVLALCGPTGPLPAPFG